MTGSPVVSATALAVPVADPPPTLSTASAPIAAACLRAASATSTGTCGRTPVNVPAIRSASGAARSRATVSPPPAAISSSRETPSRATSSASAVRAAPAPNTTRPGSASHANASIRPPGLDNAAQASIPRHATNRLAARRPRATRVTGGPACPPGAGARYLRARRRRPPARRMSPTTTRATRATTNRKCSAEITSETTRNAANTTTRMSRSFPIHPRYASAAVPAPSWSRGLQECSRPVRRGPRRRTSGAGPRPAAVPGPAASARTGALGQVRLTQVPWLN